MAKKSSSIAETILNYALMIIVLGVFGVVFAILGALTGGRVLARNSFGFGGPGLAIGGLLVGYPLGMIIGIILIKKILHRQGSMLLGISGSIFGVVITLVLSLLNLNNPGLLFWVFFLSVPVFCLAGFLLKR